MPGLEGKEGRLLAWIGAFLSGRTQKVSIGNALSEPSFVTSGVPQGSVLGPPLFLVYINDLPDCVEEDSKVDIFADDSKFHLCRKDAENSSLLSTLKNFDQWADSWQMNVALDKCHVFSAGNLRLPACSYALNGQELTPVTEIRDIGIHLTPDFKTTTHCARIAASASSRSFLVLKSFSSNKAVLLIRAYKTYIRPLLESATPVWSPYLKKDIFSVEKVQAAFTRKVCLRCGIPFENYAERLTALNLHSLEYRRIVFDLCMVFNIIHRSVDLPVNAFFSFKDSCYAMRGHPLQLKKTETPHHQFRQHAFPIRVINIWNSLPEAVVLSPSLFSFKLALDKVDLSPFCSIYNM